jgi:hypothetical protein
MGYRLGMMPPDLAGRKFGWLQVLHRHDSNIANSIAWFCLCDCGEQKAVRGTHLLTGRVKSCGCLKRSSAAMRTRTHGLTKTKTYRAWSAMKHRCFSKAAPAFRNYGGRGITVCERWLKFENFLADMGEAPSGTGIDRFPNNNGNYEPGNCRWATPAQQNNNTRKVRILSFGGESMTISEWARKLGLKRTCLATRLRIMTVPRALTFSR